MARVTVEDCLKNVKNRFELVMLATKRARQLATTDTDPTVPWEKDKPTVVALREIAAGTIDSSFTLRPKKSVAEQLEEVDAAAAKAIIDAEAGN